MYTRFATLPPQGNIVARNFSWSYTKLRDWENCPRQYRWKHVARNKEPETEQQLWGERVHSALDARAKGEPLPASMLNLEKLGAVIDKAKRIGLTVVHEKNKGQIAFDRDLRIVDDWFGKTVYGRVIVDLMLIAEEHAVIIDYKTGKKRDDDTQLKIFAGVGFIKLPTIKTIETRYVWTNGSPSTVKTYTRDDAAWIWNDILPRVDRMETGITRGQYDPKPSGLCHWCPVKECEHNTKDK
jgi:RecB family exonuclease